MPYFGYSRYPMNVRTRSIIRFVSAAFASPSGSARRRVSSSCSFSRASRDPPRSAVRRPGSKFLTLPSEDGHEHRRAARSSAAW
jgi:hypothetical protein